MEALLNLELNAETLVDIEGALAAGVEVDMSDVDVFSAAEALSATSVRKLGETAFNPCSFCNTPAYCAHNGCAGKPMEVPDDQEVIS